MKFWDTSALAPLLVAEPGSERREAQLRDDPVLAVWYGTPVELESALSRRRREGRLEAAGEAAARARWDYLEARWWEVEPSEEVRARARRLLRVHALRAADAFQLAAALRLCEERTRDFSFLTGDERLALAAEREGFVVE